MAPPGTNVERIPGFPAERLVTYSWRASGPDVQGVTLLGAPDGRDAVALTPEGDTWSATFRVRADLRHRYAFHESTDGAPFDWGLHRHALRPDPHNPVRFPDDTFDDAAPALPESEWLPASVLTLDDAPAQPWIRRGDGVPAGVVTSHLFPSEILGNTRRVWTYTPPGYRPDGEPYGLLVMNDGWEWRALTPLAPILDNLIAAGLIPPLVAVLHECPEGTREAELGCGEDFATAVGTELMPWIRSRWNVTVDPGRTIVAGQSYGGLCAAFLARRRPDLFGNVLSQSGAYWFASESLIREYTRSARVPVRFYLDVGLLEGDMVAINRRFRDVLEAAGHPVTYQEVHSDHSWLTWRGTLSDGLVALTTN